MKRILVLGVSPFEDLPGYQLLGLLKSSDRYRVFAADDSLPALDILSQTGANIERVPHPCDGAEEFADAAARLCEELGVDVLLPATDAHLYALTACLARHPRLASLCPLLKWLASESLCNKWAAQDWLSQFGNTPRRWPFETEEDLQRFGAKHYYPVMVKGMKKGAIKCEDSLEATVARKMVLRNPANRGTGGGAYLEAAVEGEEHSLFLLIGHGGERLATFAFRKLATTQLGTTLAGVVDARAPRGVYLERLIRTFNAPAIIEIEWREDSTQDHWLFEANFRFPSWIGALGAFGLELLEGYIQLVLHPNSSPHFMQSTPAEGSVFYRLPQSGFLPLNQTFFLEPGGQVVRLQGPRRAATTQAPLWRSSSPHQFLVK